MSSDWVVIYFDKEQRREGETEKLPSLAEAISVAKDYESRGLTIRLLSSSHAKLHWPLNRRQTSD